MRWLTFCTLISLALAAPLAAGKETVAELKARVDAARPEDRVRLCVQIAERQLHRADHLYTEGNVEQGRAAVEDIVTYSAKARDSATESRKHMKTVEISVRKMAEKLRDIKRTLNLEDQPPVDAAIKRLEDIRTTLLDAMFPKEKK